MTCNVMHMQVEVATARHKTGAARAPGKEHDTRDGLAYNVYRQLATTRELYIDYNNRL